MQIPKVLLVNDDAASLFALKSLLVNWSGAAHYELLTASSGHEALRHVLKHDFAVILLDVNMPGMDGFETAEAIHSHPRCGATPIIFITAHYADEMHRLQAYGKGAADYLFTPVIAQVLQTKVAVFVELTKRTMELQAKGDELARLNQDLRVQRVQDLERINRELQQEVAERKTAEERAHALSIRDALTGLVNRRSLIAQLEHAVATGERSGNEFALLFLDLDKFKSINDTLGHEAGDELLRQVAGRLLASVRVSDVVARLGGDEFVVMLPGAGAAQYAVQVARKIDQAHSHPFHINGQSVHTSTSIGIALYPHDASDAAQLMKHADTAMYHAKQNRRGSIEFFREELNAREIERARWVTELQAALEQQQFELHYQPRATLPDGALCAVEAHLYWRHPRLGTIAAPEFLPHVADRTLLDQICAWTIGAACAQFSRWHGAGLTPAGLRMSVDLAVLALTPELAQRVKSQLSLCALPQGWLELDIPEHLLTARGDAEPVLRTLKESGVWLAVDNFGSAGASLSTLRNLPLDILKIDGAFIDAIGDEGSADMVAAIIHLGRALGMHVLAQGVRHARQLTILTSLGCDQFQGELLGGAVPAAQLLSMLDDSGADSAARVTAALAEAGRSRLPSPEEPLDEPYD